MTGGVVSTGTPYWWILQPECGETSRVHIEALLALVERQATDLERLRRIEELAAATISADTHYARVPSGPNMEILERCIAALRDEVLVAGEAAGEETE